MATHAGLLKHTYVVDKAEGILPSGQWEGRMIVAELRRSTRPSEAGTDYLRYVIDAEDAPLLRFRFGGKNRPLAQQQLDELRAVLA